MEEKYTQVEPYLRNGRLVRGHNRKYMHDPYSKNLTAKTSFVRVDGTTSVSHNVDALLDVACDGVEKHNEIFDSINSSEGDAISLMADKLREVPLPEELEALNGKVAQWNFDVEALSTAMKVSPQQIIENFRDGSNGSFLGEVLAAKISGLELTEGRNTSQIDMEGERNGKRVVSSVKSITFYGTNLKLSSDKGSKREESGCLPHEEYTASMEETSDPLERQRIGRAQQNCKVRYTRKKLREALDGVDFVHLADVSDFPNVKVFEVPASKILDMLDEDNMPNFRNKGDISRREGTTVSCGWCRSCWVRNHKNEIPPEGLKENSRCRAPMKSIYGVLDEVYGLKNGTIKSGLNIPDKPLNPEEAAKNIAGSKSKKDSHDLPNLTEPGTSGSFTVNKKHVATLMGFPDSVADSITRDARFWSTFGEMWAGAASGMQLVPSRNQEDYDLIGQVGSITTSSVKVVIHKAEMRHSRHQGKGRAPKNMSEQERKDFYTDTLLSALGSSDAVHIIHIQESASNPDELEIRISFLETKKMIQQIQDSDHSEKIMESLGIDMETFYDVFDPEDISDT